GAAPQRAACPSRRADFQPVGRRAAYCPARVDEPPAVHGARVRHAHHAARDARRRVRVAHRPAPARRRRAGMSEKRYFPLWELSICRLRMFYRQPAAVFWTYGFPLVMLTALGLAFREESKETILVDIIGPQAEAF